MRGRSALTAGSLLPARPAARSRAGYLARRLRSRGGQSSPAPRPTAGCDPSATSALTKAVPHPGTSMRQQNRLARNPYISAGTTSFAPRAASIHWVRTAMDRAAPPSRHRLRV